MARGVQVRFEGVEKVREHIERAQAQIDAAVQAALRSEARRIQRQVIRSFQRVALNIMHRELTR